MTMMSTETTFRAESICLHSFLSCSMSHQHTPKTRYTPILTLTSSSSSAACDCITVIQTELMFWLVIQFLSFSLHIRLHDFQHCFQTMTWPTRLKRSGWIWFVGSIDESDGSQPALLLCTHTALDKIFSSLQAVRALLRRNRGLCPYHSQLFQQLPRLFGGLHTTTSTTHSSLASLQPYHRTIFIFDHMSVVHISIKSMTC